MLVAVLETSHYSIFEITLRLDKQTKSHLFEFSPYYRTLLDLNEISIGNQI